MSEGPIAREEIESQFPNEWVLVGDPLTDDKLKLIEGTVLHHSKDRDEVYRRAIALKAKRYATLFTGKMPKGTAIVL